MDIKKWLKENKKLVWGGGALATFGVLVLAATQRDLGVYTDPGDDYTPTGEPKRLLSKDKSNKDPFSGKPCKPGVGSCSASDKASLKALYKAERAKIRDLKKQGASESELIAAWNRLNFIALRYIWARHTARGMNKNYAVSGLGQFDFSLPDFQDDMGDLSYSDVSTEFESEGGFDEDDYYYIIKTGDVGKELFEDEIQGVSSQGTPGIESESGTGLWNDNFDTTQPGIPMDSGFGQDYGYGAQDQAYDDSMIAFDEPLMGYTLGSRSSASYTGADVIRAARALKKSGWRGQNCWEWVREAYRRAGNTGNIFQNQWLFSGSQYRYKWRNNDNKRTKNKWVKMHNVPFLPESLYSEIKPGDWLYIFNKSTGPNGGHSFIFTGWHDEAKRIADGLGNTGANKPGVSQRFDLRKHPVTHWMRPPGEAAPSTLTVGRWQSEFDTTQSQYWVQSLQNFPPPRSLQGYEQYPHIPQENGWMHTAPGTLARAPRPRRLLRLHGMNVKW